MQAMTCSRLFIHVIFNNRCANSKTWIWHTYCSAIIYVFYLGTLRPKITKFSALMYKWMLNLVISRKNYTSFIFQLINILLEFI